jgi:hypothetical protein
MKCIQFQFSSAELHSGDMDLRRLESRLSSNRLPIQGEVRYSISGSATERRSAGATVGGLQYVEVVEEEFGVAKAPKSDGGWHRTLEVCVSRQQYAIELPSSFGEGSYCRNGVSADGAHSIAQEES